MMSNLRALEAAINRARGAVAPGVERMSLTTPVAARFKAAAQELHIAVTEIAVLATQKLHVAGDQMPGLMPQARAISVIYGHILHGHVRENGVVLYHERAFAQ